MTVPPDFIDSIRDPIANAWAVLARDMDQIRAQTDFEIGRRIVEEEHRVQDPGSVIEALAQQLAADFGPGFSAANLRRMRDSCAITAPSLTPSWTSAIPRRSTNSSPVSKNTSTNRRPPAPFTKFLKRQVLCPEG